MDYTRLHKFLSDENAFRLQNLLRFFRANNEKEVMRLPEPDFELIVGSEKLKKNKLTQEQINLYHFLEK